MSGKDFLESVVFKIPTLFWADKLEKIKVNG